jgi:RNA polymerase-binding transcription factor DksA
MQKMKRLNNEYRCPIYAVENPEANFGYCKECGTIIYRLKNKQ